MKKEKDEFFHKMDKALEESEKRREVTELKKEREIQEWKVKFEKLAAAEDKGDFYFCSICICCQVTN